MCSDDTGRCGHDNAHRKVAARGGYFLSELLLAAQERPCSMELIT